MTLGKGCHRRLDLVPWESPSSMPANDGDDQRRQPLFHRTYMLRSKPDGASSPEMRQDKIRHIRGGMTSALHVEVRDLQGVADDEVAPGFDHVAHQRGEDLCRVLGIADFHLQQRAFTRVEGGAS